MAVIATNPARLFPQVRAWLAHFTRPRKASHTHPSIHRVELERALVLSQMPESLRRDLNIDGGARLADESLRRSGWPMW